MRTDSVTNFPAMHASNFRFLEVIAMRRAGVLEKRDSAHPHRARISWVNDVGIRVRYVPASMAKHDPPSQKPPPLSRIKSGALSRGLSLARIGLSAGARAASHSVSALFGDDELNAERLKALLTTQAGVLAKELGQLKGSV